MTDLASFAFLIFPTARGSGMFYQPPFANSTVKSVNSKDLQNTNKNEKISSKKERKKRKNCQGTKGRNF